jgi:hypothetical protein
MSGWWHAVTLATMATALTPSFDFTRLDTSVRQQNLSLVGTPVNQPTNFVTITDKNANQNVNRKKKKKKKKKNSQFLISHIFFVCDRVPFGLKTKCNCVASRRRSRFKCRQQHKNITKEWPL